MAGAVSPPETCASILPPWQQGSLPCTLCRVHICIWTLNSSLIYFWVQFLLQIYCQMFKTTQNYFLSFFCIFTDICSCVISISFRYLLYEGLFICFHLEVWFWVKEAPTGTLAPPDNLTARCIQVLKGWISRYSICKWDTLTYGLSPQCLHSLRRWTLLPLYNIFINFFCSLFVR